MRSDDAMAGCHSRGVRARRSSRWVIRGRRVRRAVRSAMGSWPWRCPETMIEGRMAERGPASGGPRAHPFFLPRSWRPGDRTAPSGPGVGLRDLGSKLGALGAANFLQERGMDGGEPDNRRLGNGRSFTGARRFRGERDRWGRWPDPGEILPGSFREAGQILPGSWPDPSGKLAGTFRDGSGTVRGGFEGVLAAEAAAEVVSEKFSKKTDHG